MALDFAATSRYTHHWPMKRCRPSWVSGHLTCLPAAVSWGRVLTGGDQASRQMGTGPMHGVPPPCQAAQAPRQMARPGRRNVWAKASSAGSAAALPSPPAGFILDGEGQVVLMAPESKRVLTLFDDAVGRPLECVIRRAFVSSSGLQFFLLYPLDVPVIIYRVSSQPEGGLIEADDAEVQEVFPTASYALARRNFHLVLSGYVLTVRGAVCFSQEDVTSIDVEYGIGIGSDLSEGVEIASFVHKGQKYLVYTPFDPLLFPAYKDPTSGKVLVAENDEQLNDRKVLEAIEEEEEYQRMVNEEEDMAQLISKPKGTTRDWK